MPMPTDGKSFTPLLYSKKNIHASNIAYSYYNNGISVRTNKYRLTKYIIDNKPVIELYDHLRDPYENNNIADKSPKIVNSLMALLNNANWDLYTKK
jgi:hypothetical protein